MVQPRIQLRNPWVAAGLGYLVPGAGHVYQGRYFKGLLYFLCIMGTFLGGMCLGEWRVVYFRRDAQETTYGYLAQVLVGLPALPALVQVRRVEQPSNKPENALSAPLSSEFEGVWNERTEAGETLQSQVSGTLQLEPFRGELGAAQVQGKFVGKKDNGAAVELALGGKLEMDAPIMADRRRRLDVSVDGRNGSLQGSVPRSFWNWFEVPPSDEILQDLNGRLGKSFELAKVFTWIAGLLNILAIWDALEGPAYGYGDEADQSGARRKRKDTEDEPQEQAA